MRAGTFSQYMAAAFLSLVRAYRYNNILVVLGLLHDKYLNGKQFYHNVSASPWGFVKEHYRHDTPTKR